MQEQIGRLQRVRASVSQKSLRKLLNVLCAQAPTRNSEKTRVLRCKKSVEIDRPLFRDATHRFLPLFLSFYQDESPETLVQKRKEESIRCASWKIKSTSLLSVLLKRSFYWDVSLDPLEIYRFVFIDLFPLDSFDLSSQSSEQALKKLSQFLLIIHVN